MRTIEEINRTPVGLLTDDEVAMLDPASQEWARKWKARRVREDACPGHERIETATLRQQMYGNHIGECKHCGKDMSYDSGD
jgi:hypothetical protein